MQDIGESTFWASVHFWLLSYKKDVIKMGWVLKTFISMFVGLEGLRSKEWVDILRPIVPGAYEA